MKKKKTVTYKAVNPLKIFKRKAYRVVTLQLLTLDKETKILIYHQRPLKTNTLEYPLAARPCSYIHPYRRSVTWTQKKEPITQAEVK